YHRAAPQRGALRVRADRYSRCGAVPAVVSSPRAQGRRNRQRSQGWALGPLRAGAGCIRGNRDARRRNEAARSARRQGSLLRLIFFSSIHQQILLGGYMNASESELKTTVKQKYGQAALRVADGATAGECCGSSACCGATTDAWDPITSELYDEQQKAGIPAAALLVSLGCGNPTALAMLNEGETV